MFTVLERILFIVTNISLLIFMGLGSYMFALGIMAIKKYVQDEVE